jgi:hypothetical protein
MLYECNLLNFKIFKKNWRYTMKKFALIALVLSFSVVFTLAAIQVVFVGDPTPNVGWNTWVPEYQVAPLTADAVCWSPIVPLPQPNVGWNT